MRNQDVLQRSTGGQIQLNNTPLLSGTAIEIQIDGLWLAGVIEMYGEYCCWFSKQDSVPVILKNGIVARFPDKRG